MWRGPPTIPVQALVGNVGNGLRDRTEGWWGLSPSHGQGQRECDQVWLAWHGRDGDGQSGDVIYLQPNTIEAIGNVNLKELHWPKSWVRSDDLSDESFEGPTKLHGLRWRQANGIPVDS